MLLTQIFTLYFISSCFVVLSTILFLAHRTRAPDPDAIIPDKSGKTTG